MAAVRAGCLTRWDSEVQGETGDEQVEWDPYPLIRESNIQSRVQQFVSSRARSGHMTARHSSTARCRRQCLSSHGRYRVRTSRSECREGPSFSGTWRKITAVCTLLKFFLVLFDPSLLDEIILEQCSFDGWVRELFGFWSEHGGVVYLALGICWTWTRLAWSPGTRRLGAGTSRSRTHGKGSNARTRLRLKCSGQFAGTRRIQKRMFLLLARSFIDNHQQKKRASVVAERG